MTFTMAKGDNCTLSDNFGRVHDYLRISLTDKCNLRCSYCMPFNLPSGFFADSVRMSPVEIGRMAKAFVSLGIKKIRLTGGEPFVRKEAKQILEELARFKVELAITTNGILVNHYFDDLNKAKIKSLNFSLDTLRPDRYLSITKRDNFYNVMYNIHLLLINNFNVKMNAVIMKGINDDEIIDFVEWTKDNPVHIRFIEFMPFSGNQWDTEKVITHKEILQTIKLKLNFNRLKDEKNSTSKNYKVEGYKGSFGIISTMSEPFCSDCNRLRLTSDGKLKTCLFSQDETDLLTPMRQGKDIRPLIIQSVQKKKEKQGGQLNPDFSSISPIHIRNRSMVAIGG